MEAADEAISAIPKANITELRAFNNPPETVKEVMSALLLLLDSHSLDWTTARKVLASQNFKN